MRIDDKIFVVATVTITIASLCFGVYGAISPPPGEVHPSILNLIDKMWQFLAIIELYLLIRKGRGFKWSFGKLNIEAKPESEEKNDEQSQNQ